MASADLKKKFDQIKEKRNRIEAVRGKIATVKRKIQKSKDHKQADVLKQKLKDSM